MINFGAPTLREGLRRIVKGFQPSAFPRLRVNTLRHCVGRRAQRKADDEIRSKLAELERARK